MFFKIVFLKKFASFTGKHLCWSLLLMQFTGPQACNFIKKRLQHKCFPVKCAKFLEHPQWLLLALFVSVLEKTALKCLPVFPCKHLRWNKLTNQGLDHRSFPGKFASFFDTIRHHGSSTKFFLANITKFEIELDRICTASKKVQEQI